MHEIRNVVAVAYFLAKRGSAVALVTSTCILAARADTTAGPDFRRVAVPIKQTTISNGKIRYSIAVRVGPSAEFDAMLDTGSTGLRLLPGAVSASDYSITSRSSDYRYGSGLKLSGPIAEATVSIGGVSTVSAIPIQAVAVIGCLESAPHCPASRINSDDFRIGGSGLPGQGFLAIIGISMGLSDTVNPLRRIGIRIWTVTLPRPGDHEAGTLVINPTEQERRGYTMLRPDLALAGMAKADGWRDAVAGCLIRVETDRRLCGATLLDTGTQGIRVISHEPSDLAEWDRPAQLAFSFQSAAGSELTMPFSAGSDDPSSVTPNLGPNLVRPRIMAGTLPYFAFSVLYDATRGEVGLKPR